MNLVNEVLCYKADGIIPKFFAKLTTALGMDECHLLSMRLNQEIRYVEQLLRDPDAAALKPKFEAILEEKKDISNHLQRGITSSHFNSFTATGILQKIEISANSTLE